MSNKDLKNILKEVRLHETAKLILNMSDEQIFNFAKSLNESTRNELVNIFEISLKGFKFKTPEIKAPDVKAPDVKAPELGRQNQIADIIRNAGGTPRKPEGLIPLKTETPKPIDPKTVSTFTKAGVLGTTAAGLGAANLMLNRDRQDTVAADKPADEAPKFQGGAEKSAEMPAKAAEPESFGAAFKAAREKAKAAGNAATGRFKFKGKEYQTNIKGEKYIPMSKQKSVSESLINSFLELQADKSGGNMFEAAKKLSPKEKQLAALGHPKDKITHKDVLIGRGVLSKEEATEVTEQEVNTSGKSDKMTNEPAKVTTLKPLNKPGLPKLGGMTVAEKGAMKEETIEEFGFSEAEIAYFNSIMEAQPVAPTPDDYSGPKDSMSIRNLTDETKIKAKKLQKEEAELDEMALGKGAGRGRPKGSKSGSKHGGGSGEGSETPHVIDQIRYAEQRGIADTKGNYNLKHPVTGATKAVPQKEANNFYSRYQNADKPSEKNEHLSNFLGKHFGDTRATADTGKLESTKKVSLAGPK